MKTSDIFLLEQRLQTAAEEFPYPPTPDIAGQFDGQELTRTVRGIRRPRFAWALLFVLIVASALFAVPSVRARILEFIQIGTVRILVLPVTQTAVAETDEHAQVPTAATPDPVEGEYIVYLLELDGETSLDALRQAVNFPLLVPRYPQDLGDPDRVYLQDIGTGAFAVLVWLQPGDDSEILLSLYTLGPGVNLTKEPPDVIEFAEVNGNEAVWTNGEYLLSVSGGLNPVKLVVGPALIWEQDGLTYRLEADLDKEEMIRIAESLR